MARDHDTPPDIRALQGAKLREIREARGLRQRDLAEAIGVGVNMLGHWERGRSTISRKRAVVLAKILQVNAAEFMGSDWVGLDLHPSPDEIERLARVDHTVFVQRRLEAHSDSLRRLEAAMEEGRSELDEVRGQIDAVRSALGLFLQSQATAQMRGAGERRQGEGQPPAGEERRRSRGRRRSDPPG